MSTVADQVIDLLKVMGVQRIFGMPGGGSNADLIEAAAGGGLPFSLAHTEVASAFMAAAQAEISGRPGACISTLGPGAASLTNGVANAFLDRVPLIFLTDCYSPETAAVMLHQSLENGEIFRSLVKLSARLSVDNFETMAQYTLNALLSSRPGPVHIDISQATASAPAGNIPQLTPSSQSNGQLHIPENIKAAIEKARRPVFLIGLGARTPAISLTIRSACDRFGIPALVTYKAKGVVPDRHPWFGGVLLNGALERTVLERSDLFLAVGLDVVELLPVPWRFAQPVLSITSWPMNQNHIPVLHECVGDVPGALDAITALLPERSDWDQNELRNLTDVQRRSMRVDTHDSGLPPHRVVEEVADAYPGARATVDAGAHMLPIMSLWPAKEPCGVLISNGLSTMGFAVPAAIGAALLETGKPIVAFTGDAGLLMCLGELRTAARENLPLRIIVFVDGELSLIKIKQLRRRYRTNGVTIGNIDWEAVGTGLGVLAVHAEDETALKKCLAETLGHRGPVLIAVDIAARSYEQSIVAVRG